MSDELKVTAWITDGSLRRLKPDRNFSRDTVPVHARKSMISNIGLVLRTDAERLLAERDARIAQLERERDEAIAETKRMRSAADELLEACDTSNGSCYGTLSTSFVMSVLGEPCTDRDARIAELEREMDALLEALTEVRDRLVQHPAYAQLTESEEQDIGGDTAEFSYLARVATDAIDAAMKANAVPSPLRGES